MKGCLIIPLALLIHLTMASSMWLTCGWFSGQPIQSWPIFVAYWILLFKNWRMGSQFMFNAAVPMTILCIGFGWNEWRQPASIAISRYGKGDVTLALSILDNSLRKDPSLAASHLARFSICEQMLDQHGMEQEVRAAPTWGAPSFVVDYLRVQAFALGTTPQEAEPVVNEMVEKYPTTLWFQVLRGYCRLSMNHPDEAESDFRPAVEGYDRIRGIWLRSPILYVETRYQAALAFMGLSHAARLKGDRASALRYMETAVKEFKGGAFARDAGAPGSYVFIPRERAVGNLVYAWAEALAQQSGDQAEARRLSAEAKLTLKKCRRDLSRHVQPHLLANTAPTLAEDWAAVRDASFSNH